MVSPTLIQRVKILFKQKENEPEYEPVQTECNTVYDDNEVRRPALVVPDDELLDEQVFSWFEYYTFLLLGIAMLWAWNMFLSAAPYFQTRFAANEAILNRFQSAIISISCLTSLSSTVILTQLQLKANYTRRIRSGLLLFLGVFILLAISTSVFREVPPEAYFTFILIMVFLTSVGTGLCQNGSFSFAASIGRPEYIQAIVTGQGVAGVLPSVAQIVSVLAIPDPEESATVMEKAFIEAKENSSAALSYFITAAVVSAFTFIAAIPLLRRHKQTCLYDSDEEERVKRHTVSMLSLYRKLGWLAASVFVCLGTSMFFPVFTEKIVSVIPENEAPAILRPTAFIPLGFLCWNLGDLGGRVITLGPLGRWQVKPRTLFMLVCLRFIFIPLYLICNVGGNGAKIESDAFYLIVVSGGFGLTNGYLTSLCLMNAGKYVSLEEREATGGFMVVNLLAGLTAGSFLSFAASGVGK